MKINIVKQIIANSIALIVNIVLLTGSSCFFLDVTQKQNYSTLGKNVTVKQENVNRMVYNHKFQEPLLLSDIVKKGESILFDKLFFREQPVNYAMVYWENEEPTVVHIYTSISTVVLLNNGNGRFLEESILSNVFVTNPYEEAHPESAQQVTLELNNTRNYVASGVGVSVTQVHKFDARLEPYTVNYQNVDQFRVGRLKFNNTNIDIPITNQVHGVFTYSKDGSPLLIELVNTTSKHDYYGLTLSNRWEKTYLPNIFDPLYNHYFIKKLTVLDNGCSNTFALNIDKGRMGRHPVQVHCIVRGLNKTYHKVLRSEKGVIRPSTWYRDSMDRLTYKLDPMAPFTLSSLTLGGRPLAIELPRGPYNTVTVYHFKCPILVHFSGPHTSSYYEYVKRKPYSLFKQGTASQAEIDSKIKAIVDRYHMKSVLFSCH